MVRVYIRNHWKLTFRRILPADHSPSLVQARSGGGVGFIRRVKRNHNWGYHHQGVNGVDGDNCSNVDARPDCQTFYLEYGRRPPAIAWQQARSPHY